jgi:hypothetical protein
LTWLSPLTFALENSPLKNPFHIKISPDKISIAVFGQTNSVVPEIFLSVKGLFLK